MKTTTSTTTRLVRFCAGSVIMLLVTSLTAMSTPLWEIDMSSMTTGENIQTAAYSNGVVNTKPQSVGSGAGVGSVLITENYTVGSAVLSGKSVVLTKTEPTRLRRSGLQCLAVPPISRCLQTMNCASTFC